MPELKDILSFYKKREFQEAMVLAARDREVAIRFGDHFGKRPDILQYPDEILDLVKQGATSFHSSEELWTNPKLIDSNMKKKDIDALRKGWDLIIDIDAPDWQLSRITAWLIVRALKDFGITSVSVKFSGNKGFHIGVPFEAFPETYKDTPLKDLFPDAPRNIASFILDYISEKYISAEGIDKFLFGKGLEKSFKISYPKLEKVTGKKIDELAKWICSDCGREVKKKGAEEASIEFKCPKCESSIVSKEDKQFEICPKCNVIMDKIETRKSLCQCGSDNVFAKFNPLAVVEVDTILLSSRHMFRMPYSYHEKSGLISMPFNPDKILKFEKKFADPKLGKISKNRFIDREKVVKGEAKDLLEKAMEFAERNEKKEVDIKKNFEYQELTEAIPEVLFPPCIEKMFKGMEDGKKRAIFVLINFLKSVGWDYDKIEERIIKWNEANPDHLKETLIRGQLQYHKRNKDKILPPNCDNKMYYKDMQLCIPDNFCRKIRNPVNYSVLKARGMQEQGKGKKKASE